MRPRANLIRDRDTSYGAAVTRRLQAIGIRDRPITSRSPWQNGHVERLIGSIRRECLDHVVVLGERHLRHLLANYATYYNGARTHLHSTRTRRSIDLRRPSGVSHRSLARRSPSAIRSDGIIGRHRTSSAFTCASSAGCSPSHSGHASGFRTASIRLWSSAHNSFGGVVIIVKLRMRSPARER